MALVASCSPGRKTSAVQHRSTAAAPQPKFLENISVDPAAAAEPAVRKPRSIKPSTKVPGTAFSTNIEHCNDLQFKYAILMEKSVEEVTNETLIAFLESWYGIPYKYGGEGRSGIDCSAFTSRLMDSVYRVDIPRTARSQFKAGSRISKKELEQGDLVFFNTSGGISHVGAYLGNNKFVHASTSSGVMISDLDDAYFKRRYVGSVRLK